MMDLIKNKSTKRTFCECKNKPGHNGKGQWLDILFFTLGKGTTGQKTALKQLLPKEGLRSVRTWLPKRFRKALELDGCGTYSREIHKHAAQQLMSRELLWVSMWRDFVRLSAHLTWPWTTVHFMKITFIYLQRVSPIHQSEKSFYQKTSFPFLAGGM